MGAGRERERPRETERETQRDRGREPGRCHGASAQKTVARQEWHRCLFCCCVPEHPPRCTLNDRYVSTDVLGGAQRSQASDHAATTRRAHVHTKIKTAHEPRVSTIFIPRLSCVRRTVFTRWTLSTSDSSASHSRSQTLIRWCPLLTMAGRASSAACHLRASIAKM